MIYTYVVWKCEDFMNRRAFLGMAAGGAAAILSDRGVAAKRRYNVLYVCMEDLSPYLGCYGHRIVKSPNLDAFAKDSVMLADCHCQVALCTPSRTSILTGVRPCTSGIVKIDDDWRKVLPDTVSLPRHFRDNGYYTHHVGKIYDPRCGGMDDAWTVSQEEWGVTGNVQAYAAMEKAAGQAKPFFVAIGYKQTHEPWNPTEESLAQYPMEAMRPEGTHRVYKGRELSESEVLELTRKYFASITDVDRLVGGVLDKAEELGVYENSIIVVGAMDHGYSLGENGRWGKTRTYDTETQVPLFIRVPGNASNGKEARGLTELVDVYRTLVDLCGLPRPVQRLEGASMRELLEEPEREWKKAAFSHQAYNVNTVGMKTRKYTLISHSDGEVELFDRVRDPKNSVDVSEERPEVVEKLMTALRAGWQEAVPG
jgi:arylsulfatase A-like enzyme